MLARTGGGAKRRWEGFDGGRGGGFVLVFACLVGRCDNNAPFVHSIYFILARPVQASKGVIG